MAEDFVCPSCGRKLRSAQGLGNHRLHCGKTVNQVEPAAELNDRISRLEEQVVGLKQSVELLVQYVVAPSGKNLVGINSNRIIQLSAAVTSAREDLNKREKNFEREIKGWVWSVIPEQFRPK